MQAFFLMTLDVKKSSGTEVRWSDILYFQYCLLT